MCGKPKLENSERGAYFRTRSYLHLDVSLIRYLIFVSKHFSDYNTPLQNSYRKILQSDKFFQMVLMHEIAHETKTYRLWRRLSWNQLTICPIEHLASTDASLLFALSKWMSHNSIQYQQSEETHLGASNKVSSEDRHSLDYVRSWHLTKRRFYCWSWSNSRAFWSI